MATTHCKKWHVSTLTRIHSLCCIYFLLDTMFINVPMLTTMKKLMWKSSLKFYPNRKFVASPFGVSWCVCLCVSIKRKAIIFGCSFITHLLTYSWRPLLSWSCFLTCDSTLTFWNQKHAVFCIEMHLKLRSVAILPKTSRRSNSSHWTASLSMPHIISLEPEALLRNLISR